MRAMNKILKFITISFLAFVMVSCLTKTKKNMDEIIAYQGLAAEYIAQNDFQKALHELKRIERKDAENVKTLNLIGLVYLGLEKIKPAARYFARVVKLDPEFDAARLNLGICYLEMGKLTKAIYSFKKINLRLYEYPEKVYNNLGIAYYRLKEYKKAKIAFEQAVVESPIFYPSYLYLGKVELAKDRVKSAIKVFKMAKQYCRSCLDPYYFLGLAYGKLNNDKKMRYYLNKVIKMAPKHKFARRAIALKKRMSGDDGKGN